MTITPEQQKQIKTLIKRTQGIIKDKENLAKFEEPVLWLIRRTGKVEYYPGIKTSQFEFEHSDGQNRILIIGPPLLHFDYGKDTFSGYICHEDYPTPLPSDPLITTELVTILIDKTLNDMKKWKAEEWKAKGKFVWYILGGIAVIILAYAVLKMFSPPTIAATKEAVKQVIQNMTTIQTTTQTTNTPPIIIK